MGSSVLWLKIKKNKTGLIENNIKHHISSNVLFISQSSVYHCFWFSLNTVPVPFLSYLVHFKLSLGFTSLFTETLQVNVNMRGADGKQCSVFVYREILILNTLIDRLLIIIFPLSKLVYIRFNSKWLNRLQAIPNECSYRNEILVKILESADPTPLY